MRTSDMVAGLLALATVFPAFAGVDDHWDDQFGPPGVDYGTVLTITQIGGNLYMGGSFGAAGEARSTGIAQFDGTNWTGFAGGVSGGGPLVFGIAAFHGNVYAGGYFTNAGGIAAPGLAQWNGSGWSSVGGGVNGVVCSLLVLSNNLYVGGNFTQAGAAVAATNIARWDGTNWFALGPGLSGTTNNNGSAIPSVLSLTTNASGSLLASGVFRYAGSLEVDNVARWDGQQWNSMGGATGGAYPFVNQIISDGTNLYIAGAFRSVNSLNLTNLARWDGNQWNALGGGPSGTNLALALVAGQIYTAGNFTNIGGTRMLNAAHWNGAGWEPLAPGYAGEVSSTVSCAAAVNGQLYIGGNFLRAGNAGVIGLAKWDGAEWSAVNGRATKGVWLIPRAILKTATRLYVGGGVVLAGGIVANRIAQFDGTNWDSMGGGVTGNSLLSPTVGALIEYGGNIYAGGYFTNAGGVGANNVAMWDGSSWHGLGSGLNSNVNALVVYQGTLFAGGAFTARGDGSGSLHGIAQFDGSAWQDVPTISYWRVNNIFDALTTDGVNLYAGGNFDIGWQTPPPIVTGDDLENVGYWDGAAWHSMGTAMSNTVAALALQNGVVYAGGSFTNSYSGGTPLLRIAQWNGSSWSQVGAGFTSGAVNALAADSSYVYAGGTMTNSGGTYLNRIARWDGSVWSGLGGGVTNEPVGSASIAGMSLAGGDLYVTGNFTRAGFKPSSYIGHWNGSVSFGPPLPLVLMNPRLSSGQFSFNVSGVRNGTFTVETSTDLLNWAAVFSGDSINTNYSEAASPGPRFFQVRTP